MCLISGQLTAEEIAEDRRVSPNSRPTALPPSFRRRRRCGHLLRLSRPRFWLYLGGPVIVGVSYAADGPAELFAPLAIALFAYFLVPANVFLYGVNDVFDADVDEANPKKDDREARWRGDRGNTAVVVASGALALLFVLGSDAGVVAVLAWIGLAVEYSAPPLRFKTTPLLDSVSNGLYVLPGVAAYAAVSGSPPSAPWRARGCGRWGCTRSPRFRTSNPTARPGFGRPRRPSASAGPTGTAPRRAALGRVAFTSALGSAVCSATPAVVFGILGIGVDVDRAYWWYPVINTVVGMLITLGALWRLVMGNGESPEVRP